jgi:hypothetical protein
MIEAFPKTSAFGKAALVYKHDNKAAAVSYCPENADAFVAVIFVFRIDKAFDFEEAGYVVNVLPSINLLSFTGKTEFPYDLPFTQKITRPLIFPHRKY